MNGVATSKPELRQLARDRLRALSPEIQAASSRSACEQFLSHQVFKSAESLLLYMPLKGELDVRLIFDAAKALKKNVALLRFRPESGDYGAFFVGEEPLVTGPFGIFEPAVNNPVPLNRLDLIVVPGLAFDLRGRRLGRGKGFYDRLLSATTGVKCGICFDEQLLAEIPVEPHDVSLDFVATPTRWLDCRGLTPETK